MDEFVGYLDIFKVSAEDSANVNNEGSAGTPAIAIPHRNEEANATVDAVASENKSTRGPAKAYAVSFDCEDIANRASVIVMWSGGTSLGDAYSYARVRFNEGFYLRPYP